MIIPDDVKKFFAKCGRKGGKARADNLTPERRSEIAKIANAARKCNRKRKAKP